MVFVILDWRNQCFLKGVLQVWETPIRQANNMKGLQLSTLGILHRQAVSKGSLPSLGWTPINTSHFDLKTMVPSMVFPRPNSPPAPKDTPVATSVAGPVAAVVVKRPDLGMEVTILGGNLVSWPLYCTKFSPKRSLRIGSNNDWETSRAEVNRELRSLSGRSQLVIFLLRLALGYWIYNWARVNAEDFWCPDCSLALEWSWNLLDW